jgi:hypothetical protein
MRDATPDARRVDPATWRRIGTLTRSAFGLVRDVYTRIVVGALAGAVVGTVVAFVTAPSPQGLVTGVVVAAIPVLLGAAPLIDRDRRRAFELIIDLRRAGVRSWKKAGTIAAPESRGDARRWLDSHPDEPIPIGILLVVGRLEDADEAIAALGDVPPDHAFDVELLRQTRRVYGGETPDLDPLRELLRQVPEPRIDVARGELAALEAQAAVAAGDDPLPILAAARLDMPVHLTARAPVFVARWLLVAVVPVILAWLIRPALPL